MLYNSSQAANNRDVPGSAVKFATPTIANGKVFVGSQASLSVFGLLSIVVVPTAPSPVLSLPSGSYDSAQTVSISDSLSSAVIHYTLDNTTPTAGSPTYRGAIQITNTTTVQALAVASGYNNSAISAATGRCGQRQPCKTEFCRELHRWHYG